MIPRQGGDPVRLHDAFGATPVPGEDGQMFFVRGGYYDGWARRHFPQRRNAACVEFERRRHLHPTHHMVRQ